MEEIPLNTLHAMPNEIFSLIAQKLDIHALSCLSLAHRDYRVYSAVFRPLLESKKKELCIKYTLYQHLNTEKHPDTYHILLEHAQNGNFPAVRYILRSGEQKLTLRSIDVLKLALRTRQLEMLEWLLGRWKYQVPDNGNHLRELLYESARWGYSDLFYRFAQELGDRWCLSTAIINAIPSGNVEFTRELVEQIGHRAPIHEECGEGLSAKEPCYLLDIDISPPLFRGLAHKSPSGEMVDFVGDPEVAEKLESVVPKAKRRYCSCIYHENWWWPHRIDLETRRRGEYRFLELG